MPEPPLASIRRLRVTGWARYVDAAFLLLWLAIWAVGEAVSLALIGAMLASAVSAALGRPLALASRVAPTDGSVSLFLLFLLLWTALWTVGGIAAAAHLLRSVNGEDLVEITGHDVRLTRRTGPFRRRRHAPHQSIRRVRIRGGYGGAVVVDTGEGTLEISDLGTSAERVALHDWLTTSLGLPDAERARAMERETPPHDRDVEVRGEETILTQPTRRGRAVASGVAWTLVAIVALGWVDVLRRGMTPGPGEFAALAATVLVTAGAVWMTAARREWIAAPGRLQVRWGFAAWTLRLRTFAGGTTVHLEHTRDGDGDDRYRWSGTGAGLATALGDRSSCCARRVARRAPGFLRSRHACARHFARARRDHGADRIRPVPINRPQQAVESRRGHRSASAKSNPAVADSQ